MAFSFFALLCIPEQRRSLNEIQAVRFNLLDFLAHGLLKLNQELPLPTTSNVPFLLIK